METFLNNKYITKTVYKVSDFISWQRSRSLSLSPSFQRRPVWKSAAKSLFIDTVVRGFPIPIIFIREQTNLRTLEPIREVVDGQQRLRTLISYIEPNLLDDYNPETEIFNVEKMHNAKIAGTNFDQLDVNIKKRILNYEMSVHVLPSDTEDREVLQIFARMNSTGVKVNDQELRNAEFYGAFKNLAYELAYEELNRWRKWKVFSENDIARMKEVEEVSDLILTMIEGIHGKNKKVLDNLYATYETEFPPHKEVKNRFRAVMDKIDDTLGKDLRDTQFSRKALFHTLFTFYYDLMYGLGSEFVRVSPKPIGNDVVTSVKTASERIKSGNLDEDLSKVLRGATAHAASRNRRMNFLKENLKSAKSKLLIS